MLKGVAVHGFYMGVTHIKRLFFRGYSSASAKGVHRMTSDMLG